MTIPIRTEPHPCRSVPQRVVHLVDDDSWGGVTRGLGFIAREPRQAQQATPQVVAVPRGSLRAPEIVADAIVSHLTISWRSMPLLTALRARYPHLAIAHVEHSYCEGFVAGNVMHRLRFGTLLRSAYALFDQIVSVSAAQRDWLSERGLVSRPRLRLLRSCAGIADFLALPVVARAPRHFAAFGRFVPQKGFDLLIPAFRRIARQDLTLTFVGDGPQRAELEALAGGDPRIRFAGYSSSPATLMARFDAVLMPSRYEAYGLIGLEAMAAGRALLVSGVDGLADHVARGAYQCRSRAPEDWAAAILSLAGEEPVAGTQRRLQARAAVRGAEETFCRGYDALYRRLLSGSPDRG